MPKQQFPAAHSSHLSKRVGRMRKIAHVMDKAVAVPGTNWRLGIDPILGLFPGFGDIAGTIVSLYIVLESARLGAPQSTILRMFANIAIDAIVGAVPVLGDLFDASWKANSRNVELAETQLGVAPSRPMHPLSLAVLVVGIVALVLGMGAFALYCAMKLWQYFSSAVGSIG